MGFIAHSGLCEGPHGRPRVDGGAVPAAYACEEEVCVGHVLDDASAVLVGRAQHLGFTLAGKVRPQARRALERLVRAAVATAVHEWPRHRLEVAGEREPMTDRPRQGAALDELLRRGGAVGRQWGRLDAAVGDVGDNTALEEGLVTARERLHLHHRDARVTAEKLRARDHERLSHVRVCACM